LKLPKNLFPRKKKSQAEDFANQISILKEQIKINLGDFSSEKLHWDNLIMHLPPKAQKQQAQPTQPIFESQGHSEGKSAAIKKDL